MKLLQKFSACLSLIFILVILSSCSQTITKTVSAPIPTDEVKTVSLIAAGDNLIHSYIYKEAKKNATDGGYNFLPSYKNISDQIKNADLAFLNQETVLGGSKLGLSGYPLFNSPTELGRDMATLGFDVFNCATNHVLDKGETGVKNTLDFWKSYPDVLPVGLYENETEKNTIHTIERGGVKFAVLAYTYGTNGITLPKESSYKVAYIDEGLILNQIAEAKKIADVVLVSMHWGAEDSMVIEDWQRSLAEKMANAGCDMIIGQHPHVLRSIEWVTRQDGSKMLCAYSLGNLISTQKVAANLLGGLLSANITVDKSSEHAQIDSVTFLPTIAEYDKDRSFVQITPLKDMTDARFMQHGARVEDKNVNLQYYQNLLKKLMNTPNSAIQ